MANTLDRGDYVDSDDELDIEEAAENAEQYTQGLFYPVCIGEVLAGRYRIEHKLGHGGFSVVWMAHDTHGRRDVALKIMVPGDSGDQEYRTHTEIANAVSEKSRLLLYQDTFLLTGSRGYHRVLVLPLQGPNLRDYARHKPAASRMFAAQQLLQGIETLHGGGFVHRDLNSANVMFGLLPTSSYDTTIKYQYIGRPRKMIIPFRLWKPGELVMPMAPQEELVTDDVLIGDFGLAMQAGTPTTHRVQGPAVFCAPELVHGMHASFASDIWSYMCLFAHLYTGFPLFSGRAHSTSITSIVNKLGPLPVQWKDVYHAGTCDPGWYTQHWTAKPELSLENTILRLRSDITAAELRLVLAILRWGLSYLPKDRPTAAQLLQSAPFKELMAIYL